MVNKKLMTSLFDIKFEWGSAYSGWTFYKSNEQTVINPPSELHLYLNDKIPNPAAQTDYNIVYAKPAGESTIRRYKFTWKDKRTGEPWDYTTDVVFGDITLILDTCEEQYWTIYFATPQQKIYSTQETAPKRKEIIPGRVYEAVPNTIINVRHNQSTFSSAVMNQINNYATLSDSSVNQFYYNNGSTSDNLIHSCWSDEWYCTPYSNLAATPVKFTWGTTPVKNNYWMFPNWKYKTYKLYLNYNTGTGYYYNDFSGDFTFNGTSYTKTTNIQYSYDVDDNFAPSTCSNATDINNAAWNLEGAFPASGWNSATTKVIGWYTDINRTSGFDLNAKMTGDKTAFAKWGIKYDGTARSQTAPWSSSGTLKWTTPSFCNKISVYLLGGGGNSSYENDAQATGSEQMECEICTPGGWGASKTKSYENVAKKTITLNIGGPATATTVTVSGFSTETAAAGGTGSRNYKSFNLKDADKGMEKAIGDGGNLASYIRRYGSTKLVEGVSRYKVWGNYWYGFCYNGWGSTSGRGGNATTTWHYGFYITGELPAHHIFVEKNGAATSGEVVKSYSYERESDRGGSQGTYTSWSGVGDKTRKLYFNIYTQYTSSREPVPGSPGMAYCVTRSGSDQSVQGSGVGGQVIISYVAD